jgi:hypothetical protein
MNEVKEDNILILDIEFNKLSINNERYYPLVMKDN